MHFRPMLTCTHTQAYTRARTHSHTHTYTHSTSSSWGDAWTQSQQHNDAVGLEINEDELLTGDVPVKPKSCGVDVGPKKEKKACKNCSCGLAEELGMCMYACTHLCMCVCVNKCKKCLCVVWPRSLVCVCMHACMCV